MNRVSHVDGFARKALGDVPPRVGYRIEKLSHELTVAGVPTPLLTFQPVTRELIAPWVNGYNGRERLQHIMQDSQSFANVSAPFWRSLFEPLAQLHRSELTSNALKQLDPYRRIRSRLENKDPCGGTHALGRERRLYQTLANTSEKLTSIHDVNNWVPVHGDFHVGQVMFGTDSDTPVLLDLDDLALTVPESDIGNCIAHLVTAFGHVTQGVFEKFNHLKLMFQGCYFELTSVSLSPELINFYGAIALLRRELKLVERDRDLSLKCILGAAEALVEASSGENTEA